MERDEVNAARHNILIARKLGAGVEVRLRESYMRCYADDEPDIFGRSVTIHEIPDHSDPRRPVMFRDVADADDIEAAVAELQDRFGPGLVVQCNLQDHQMTRPLAIQCRVYK